ncbi:MAG: 50S ribosomal protein L32 [Alphaproteobacteria bacterium]|nr:50S ribosomal protein L32 [Alphaproteobacteria bacterium]MBQ8346124.1 50S ribosomal protein L32 [Alphaproteobacteria bacterium]
MATPRSKKSKSARDMRRSHLALKSNAVMECPNCGEIKRPHNVCPSCGSYNGKEVVTQKADNKAEE